MTIIQKSKAPIAERIAEYIERVSKRLGGTPVFIGTRVPVKTLFDYLKAGDSLDVFLSDFPGVSREQAQAIIELAGIALVEEKEAR